MGKKILDRFEEIMGSITYAEAGDFVTAKRIISNEDVQPSRKTVLLGVEGCEVSRNAILHVSGLCKRLDAKLELLVITSKRKLLENDKAKVNPVLTMLEGKKIDVKLEHRSGSYEKELLKYIKERRSISSVVCSQTDCRSLPPKKNVLKDLIKHCKKLGCPVEVVVA